MHVRATRVGACALAAAVLCGAAIVACGGGGGSGGAAGGGGAAGARPPVVLVGAGDIAGPWDADAATAALLDGIAGTVFTLGDNAYDNASAADFATHYEPTWGRHKARTLPALGNHDHRQALATPYFDYFHAGHPALAALDANRRGYYSRDLGAWHVVVLDSADGGTIAPAQLDWLRADLAAHPAACTLALWHHPRFSSGSAHGSNAALAALWKVLFDGGVDVVLNGHEHLYERFDPQTDQALPDARGIRAFTVGTGGAPSYAFAATPAGNSAARATDVFGVLKLTLRDSGYDWAFVPVAGQTYSDSGSSACTNSR